MNAAGAGGGEDPNNHPHNNPYNPDNVTNKAKNKRAKTRRKIENRRIENEESSRNNFAEHRTRLYGGANELATVRDTHVGVSGLTPNGGNIAPFIFEGRPVFMRQFGEHQARMAALNARYNQTLQRLHAATQRQAELTQRSREVREADAAQGLEPGWWEKPIDEMSTEEVDRNMVELDRLYGSITAAEAVIRNLRLRGEDEPAGSLSGGGGADSKGVEADRSN